MNRTLAVTSGLLLSASTALAGGLERSAQSVAILFEPGNYAEFTLGAFNPVVTGVGNGPFAGLVSGDMAGSYVTYSLGYKQALNDKVDLAIIVDQPIGASVSYPAGNAPYPFAGSSADVESLAVTGLLRYKLPSNFSVIGGVRVQASKGQVHLETPVLTNYDLSADRDTALGYVMGVAWEKPEIAARVALTYNSKIDQSYDTVETGLALIPLNGTLDVQIPQSVNLEFQTGIAADTLLFGSIRWVDWTVFDITPQFLGSPIVSYSNDIVTYNLGVGRKFNEQWSGAVLVGYEKNLGDPVGNLGATDGYTSFGLAATYKVDNMKITGGVRYVAIGDATTTSVGSSFNDNSGIGAGIRVGYSF
ncbi:outer membrane protein transport protein [Defluviimonas sp. WL0050]|uniref:Outer membrane protein transport protein n=1 Tax=Albidovulum litorale TaxID=2984134 RepID=A0ABT2ZPA6_9RHOB|nr:outer membrane protein transport protein [Defluviimonas sp. WL0050]MCV2872918.1 outer membrane protein transport protein [Defluviimonas sp. WL0050]